MIYQGTTLKKISAPTYNYFVEIEHHDELVEHTISFLKLYAIKPLSEISVEEINEFLLQSWRRARWAGEGLTSSVKVPV